MSHKLFPKSISYGLKNKSFLNVSKLVTIYLSNEKGTIFMIISQTLLRIIDLSIWSNPFSIMNCLFIWAEIIV